MWWNPEADTFGFGLRFHKWTRDYIPKLATRSKWCERIEPIRIGDLVFLVDEKPPNMWKHGFISDVRLGKDEQVRMVKFTTKKDGKEVIYERPVSKRNLLLNQEKPSTNAFRAVGARQRGADCTTTNKNIFRPRGFLRNQEMGSAKDNTGTPSASNDLLLMPSTAKPTTPAITAKAPSTKPTRAARRHRLLRQPPRRQATLAPNRWSLRLSAYDYEIRYIKGAQQYAADLLSRNAFCGFLDADTIKIHQNNIPTHPHITQDTNGLHTITRKGVTKILIPETLRSTLLNKIHLEYNHPGISQMSRLISGQYNWSGMSRDIKNHVNSFTTCQLTKQPKGPTYGELGQIPSATKPFDLLSIDTVSGFAKYSNSKTHLHVIVDHMTRYAWAFPSKSTSTLTYIQAIKKVLVYGSPKRLLSDRAPSFTSEKFRRFLIAHGIQPLNTTSNKPQANGLCERLNSTITELSNHINSYPPIDIARQQTYQRTQLKHDKDKQKFDLNHKTPNFEIGDLVLVKVCHHPNTGKLTPYFTGPYIILEIISPNVVRSTMDRRSFKIKLNFSTKQEHLSDVDLHSLPTSLNKGFEVLEHPAYSPDLAPSDYFLFGLLKKELKGKRFDSDEDVQKVVQDFFHTLPKSAYKEGIYKLPER
ncbi:hypothetical protein LAZ67_18001117 [Cordylochernes scorpioides]|uniref:RNA-directed DNA polymerase n=1 Tax=Cordylochernes scorpioides TaxID=51811 RepID=A0ABY6LGD8_9ARAC|nr:hypothetical protein LAZ67_18001117 [Cordylochernes scorpioides]